MARQDLEKPVIDKFEHVARQRLPTLGASSLQRGLGADNRIAPTAWALPKNQQFQFGDLRVELPDRSVVVESDTAGGVTNLVKYWALAESCRKPLYLIHVFRVASENDYISHRLLWAFLWEQMSRSLPQGTMRAAQFTYSMPHFRGLELALTQFGEWLTDEGRLGANAPNKF